MITFSNLGKKGNLGNQLFQIASTIGIAEKNNQVFCFPKWQYSEYFKFKFNTVYISNDWVIVKENKFSCYEWELPDGNYDLSGWLQTEKYFLGSNIKEVFQFNNQFENDLVEKHQFLFSKKTILVTVRRGDFVNNPNYFQLSYQFYLTALIHHFENLEDYNIVFTSDNIKYCKKHFSFLPNVYFLENLNPIEQLCLGSKMDNYVISNSTFSWWLAWLGEKKESKIIRPVQIFDNEYSKKYDESDYFPDRWIVHDATKYKLSNKYWKLKVYGFLYSSVQRTKYNYKKNKKSFKNRIKKLINYNAYR
ncbi:alpha-1,2-fucosyltransferase [Flavobacterium daemonense]|uniref:alpha-1,2-fucosyltransferase n=1 Tax=Flavobacterium daemonense TaxID=1393049 RepID=UPI0011856A7D|nr:alpha-1,2-fucosyltransferase [Flavobacterium daemonense]KAF2333113.1 alpha-1,2-fucosyltransferase [Flavobacterium daemonense]